MQKKVFVIIVTYNGAKWIEKCIASLLASSYPLHIIVVDNNSNDDTINLLRQFPDIEIIGSGTNLGFGRANNIGMKKALEMGADYLFLLNQDTWIFGNTIASLVAKMEEHQIVGILSPMHYGTDEMTLDIGFAAYYSRKINSLNNILSVPFVNAAAWMLSQDCVKKTGFFEPEFSHYGEDRNYCDRVRYHGFDIAIDENSGIVHDRIISRNFKKDIIQSRYKILATLLNINLSPFKAYIIGLREVLGLPKYFAKHYRFKALSIFLNLSLYYCKMLFLYKKIKKIRNSHK